MGTTITATVDHDTFPGSALETDFSDFDGALDAARSKIASALNTIATGSVQVLSSGAGFVNFLVNGEFGSVNYFGSLSNPTITSFVLNLPNNGVLSFQGSVGLVGGAVSGTLSGFDFQTTAGRFGFSGGNMFLDSSGTISGSASHFWVGVGKLQVSLGGSLNYDTSGRVTGTVFEVLIYNQDIAHLSAPYDSIHLQGLSGIDVTTLGDLFSGVTTTQDLLDKFSYAGTDDIVLDIKSGIDFDSGAGNDFLQGGRGNDTLLGGDGNDTVVGGQLYLVDVHTGDDTLNGGAGDDALAGGDGNDLADFSNALGSVVASLVTGLASDGLGGSDTLTGIEALRGGAFADTLTGSAGADTLEGGGGADSLAGGAGNDVYVVSDGTDTLVELSGQGIDTVRASLSWTLADNLENLQLIGNGLSATGNGLANVITGTAGDDTLDGGGGRDTLIGGGGDDTYVLDPGDVIVDNGGSDTAIAGIELAVLPAGVDNVTLTGIAGNGVIGGSAAANHLVGNGGTNVLSGGGGNDTLEGGRGDDFLFGGAGNDRLDGGAGADVTDGGAGNDVYVVSGARDHIMEAAGGGIDTVEVDAVRYALDANVENAIITREGGAIVTGNALANRITGGAGSDTFVFDSRGPVDTILDFTPGVDTIALDRDVFSPGAAGMTYDAGTGALFYDGVQLAVLGMPGDHPTFTADDLQLV